MWILIAGADFPRRLAGAACALALLLAIPRHVLAGDDPIFANGFDSVAVGVLLGGTPDAPAIDAIVDMQPVAAPNADVDGNLILTRIDMAISRTATVGQINAALDRVGARIVTMTPQRPEITVAIPRPADRAQLRQIRESLETAPGVLSADLALLPQLEFLPLEVPRSTIRYLAATRFPAAWNARRLATTNCESRKVEMRFGDIWGHHPPAPYATFPNQVPGFAAWIDPLTSSAETHGYETAATAAAILDAQQPNGANPFSQCVNIIGVDVNGMSVAQEQKLVAQSLPAGKVIVNRSMGFHGPFCHSCQPEDMADFLTLPANLARQAIQWRSLTRARDADLFVSVAAGNEYDTDAGGAYEFFSNAAYVGSEALSASGLIFGPTGNLGFLQDRAVLDPDVAHPQLPSLFQSNDVVARIQTYEAENLGAAQAEPVLNTLTVGSTTKELHFDAVRPSLFSRRGAAVDAVGEGIDSFSDDPIRGTSFTSPQVAALASYLWLLSDDLRSRPASETVDAIIDNKRDVEGLSLIDAYATVLSLDDASDTIVPSPATMPIRLAILDVDDSGAFDDADLRQLHAEIVANVIANGDPIAQAWGRSDLNGDGYVGGGRTTAFDLDRRGSARYGATVYGNAQYQAEGHPVTVSETDATDLNVLCYYAYSPLFTGSAATRTKLLGAPCASRFPPALANPGQRWQAVVNSGVVAFMATTTPAQSDVQQGLRVGAWVQTFDLITDTPGARVQLAPLLPDGPNAGQPDIVNGTLIVNASTTGSAIAMWLSNDGHSWFSRFNTLDGHWGLAQPIVSDLARFFGLVLDGDGNALAIGSYGDASNATFAYAYYDNSIGQWSGVAPLPATSGAFTVFNPNNVINVGHALVANSGSTIYLGFNSREIYHFDRATRTWLGPEAISATPERVNLALSSHSDVLATWRDPDGTRLLHSRRRNSATGQWSDTLTVPDSNLVVDGPFVNGVIGSGLVGDDAGNGIATWYDEIALPGGGIIIRLKASYYSAASGTWGPTTRLDTSTYGVGTSGSIGMPAILGRARVVFHQHLDFNNDIHFGPIVTRSFDPARGWGPLETIQSGLQYLPDGALVTTSAIGTTFLLYGRQSLDLSTREALLEILQ